MSDDNSDRSNLSRRKALAGLGGIGAAAAFGGYGTLAAFNDEEYVNSTFTAGELDLRLDWVSQYNGQIIENNGDDFGPLSDDVSGSIQTSPTNVDGEMIINLGDVKPGDSGCTVISIHIDDNPAFVWMHADATGSENGLTEPEAEAENETDHGPNVQPNDDGELLDAMQVNVFYDDSYDCEFNNPENVDTSVTAEDVDSGSVPDDFFTAFRTLTGSGIASEKGILLDGVRGTGQLARSNPGNKWLSPFFQSPTDAQAEMAAAGSPANEANVFTDATSQDITDSGLIYAGEPGNFATSPVDGSFQEEGTQYIAFKWRIPYDVGNEIQGDSLEVKLTLNAQQARHTEKPLSPFNPNGSESDREPDYPIDLAPEVDPADYYGNPWNA